MRALRAPSIGSTGLTVRLRAGLGFGRYRAAALLRYCALAPGPSKRRLLEGLARGLAKAWLAGYGPRTP